MCSSDLEKVEGEGFIVESLRLNWLENSVEIVAKKHEKIIK